MEGQEITLELRMASPGHFRSVLLVVIGFVLLYIVFTIQYFGADFFGITPDPTYKTGKTPEDSRLMVSMWAFLLLPGLLIPMLYAARRMRLTINESGIYYESGLGNWLKSFMPDWSVRWEDLQETSWQVVPGQYIASRLLLHTRSNLHLVSPWNWIESGTSDVGLFPPRSCTREQAATILGHTPLVEHVKKRFPGYRSDSFNETKRPTFELGIDGRDVTLLTATIAALFIGLVILFIVEIYFTASEFYADDVPYLLIGICASLGFIASHLALKRTEPDRKDSNIYALLLALGMGLAAYPFLLRVNAWSDSAGLNSYEYYLDSDYVWRAKVPGPPNLHLYLGSSPWWRQFQPGDNHVFNLRQGRLGFWQVDMSPIYEAQKNFSPTQ